MELGRDFNSDNNIYSTRGKGFIVFEFLKDFFVYISWRLRQILLFFLAFIKLLLDGLTSLKAYVVRRMFWGRGSFYRTAFHIIVFSITVVIALSGVSNRLNIMAASTNATLALNNEIVGSQDLIYQSGTVESLTVLSEEASDLEIFKYVVQKGDTLSSIAKLYSKNVNTLVWANNLTSSNQILTVGTILRIPAIDGAYYTVKSGDTLSSIAKKTGGSVDDILGLNSNLDASNPVISVGMEIFVPNGTIPVAATVKSSNGTVTHYIPSGFFVNPLKDCPGYIISSGYGYRSIFGSVSFHNGIDMAKAGGCWEEAAGAGTVIKAGYGGYGYTVIIDHGNGIQTIYGHGNGTYAVKAGDKVAAGQRLMYMGCSGVCTGTHLHFTITVNGNSVNPFNYVNL